MNRVSTVVEKNIVVDAPLFTVLAAGVAQDVLPSIVAQAGIEYASRYIQNVGANATNYALGEDCSAINYHGQLAAGQQLNCSDNPMRVSCYSAAGTTIVGTVMRRADLNVRVNIATGNNNINGF